ncbi:MAG TPA: OmpH family outer membrane protein [Marinobacter sp.]|uniref:OmpH family outer membrane protein n=1 Tax=marine sediment metagenome TaxID=412755 RepID=A0A0F9MZT8_9ZZZZ|nr:OmpH family outer membrane protein [Marinobacter sp.]
MGNGMKIGVLIVLLSVCALLWATEVEPIESVGVLPTELEEAKVELDAKEVAEKSFSSPIKITSPRFPPVIIPTVAVCDPHRVFDKYEAPKEAFKALELRVRQARTEVQARIQAVMAKQKELDAAKKKNKEKLEADLIEMKAALKSFITVSDTRVADQRRKIAADAYLDIYNVVAKIARQRGITLVLTKDQPKLSTPNTTELLARLYYRRSVLYADDSLDITDAVIEVLNDAR